jgi:hypothetical protein
MIAQQRFDHVIIIEANKRHEIARLVWDTSAKGNDLRLGLAAGAVLGVVAAPWLYLTLRFSLVGADRPTERRAMLDRFRQQFSNRRKAAADKGKGSGA